MPRPPINQNPTGVLRRVRPWTALALLTFLLPAQAADPLEPGRRIYIDRCASCHGPNGEGVPGEYDQPLHGDDTLSRLTRIVDRTMPDDDPRACVGDEAAAVARYVFETFYSPDSPGRRRTARVELVRLTNRQFLSSVADLVGQFRGDALPAAQPDEHGLRAEYFRSRGFNRDRLAFDRVDSQVAFEYGLNSPDPERIEPDEFAIRWRGSVLVEDSGDHEFAVETPNGVRLWVNGDTTPLIDAAVASGGARRHSATIRLLGGRAYPVRLEYVKSRNEAGSISFQWKPPRSASQAIPPHRLVPEVHPPTATIATPFPADDASVGYERGVSVSRAWDEATTQAAFEVADHVASDLDALAGTRSGAPDRADKVRAWAHRWAEAAFRRPLTEEQRERFVEAPFARSDSIEAAARTVVLLTLKSPRFLYLGLTQDRADSYEVALRLSYALWDSLPDVALYRRAAGGGLATREEVRDQAERMRDHPRTRSKLRHALHHWLDMNHGPHFSKDREVYPEYSPELEADLRTSLDLFLEDVVWSRSSDYRDLLLRPDLWVNDRVARFYGIEASPGLDWVKVQANPSERSGVLTHPYLLAAFSYPRSSSPIHRGVFLTRNIVGRALRSPPVAVEFNDATFDAELTMREKVTELTRPDACWSCHSVINPLGFSLEHYDAVGRFRTTDSGRPVDASGEYPAPNGENVPLGGARDLARYAAESETAQTAFVEMLFHQVVKQPALAYGPDTLSQLRTTFAGSDFNVRHLLVEIAMVAAWHGVEATPPNP